MPYIAILKSPAVWGINAAIIANGFGIYTLLTKLPAFFKEVLHYDVRSVSSSSMRFESFDVNEYKHEKTANTRYTCMFPVLPVGPGEACKKYIR